MLLSLDSPFRIIPTWNVGDLASGMRLRSSFLLAMLLCSPAHVAFGQTETFVEVKGDSPAQGVLPFDEPIVFWGALSDSAKGRVDSVRVWRRESRQATVHPFNLARAFQGAGDTDAEGDEDGCTWNDGCEWKNLASEEGFGAAVTPERFLVSVPGLTPNRFYQYVFVTGRKPTPAETSSFETKALAKLVPVLRKRAIGDLEAMTADFVTKALPDSVAQALPDSVTQARRDSIAQKLPDSVIRDVTDVTLDSVRAVMRRSLPRSPFMDYDLSGSVFDPETKWVSDSTLREMYAELVRPYQRYRYEAFKADATWQDFTTSASFELDTLNEEGRSKQLLLDLHATLLKAKPTTDQEKAVLATLLAGSSAGYLLAHPPPLEKRKSINGTLARGERALGPDGYTDELPVTLQPCGLPGPKSPTSSVVCLSTVDDPDTVKPFLKNIQMTRESLGRVGAVVSYAQQSTATLVSGLNPEALTALEEDLEEAYIALGAVEDALSGLTSEGDYEQATLSALRKVGRRHLETTTALNTTRATFKTRAKFHISADAGLLYGVATGEVLPYFGVNFYFRSVNREIPLGLRFNRPFWYRASLTLGITVASIEEDGERSDLFGGVAGLVGLGYRLTDHFRLSAGTLVFRKDDPNPLVTDRSVALDPFVSLSIDWDVQEVLGGVSKIFK